MVSNVSWLIKMSLRDVFPVLTRLSPDNICSALGVTNCCLWIEEIISSSSRKGKTNESTVLFDEDRFFHIKNIRAQKKQPLEIDLAKIKDKRNNHKLALSVDEFDLVLETCLRGQGMSTYISSQSRKTMMSC